MAVKIHILFAFFFYLYRKKGNFERGALILNKGDIQCYGFSTLEGSCSVLNLSLSAVSFQVWWYKFENAAYVKKEKEARKQRR